MVILGQVVNNSIIRGGSSTRVDILFEDVYLRLVFLVEGLVELARGFCASERIFFVAHDERSVKDSLGLIIETAAVEDFLIGQVDGGEALTESLLPHFSTLLHPFLLHPFQLVEVYSRLVCEGFAWCSGPLLSWSVRLFCF